MANHKSPGRESFDRDLAEITKDIPKTYTACVQLFRPDLDAELIRTVRFGKRVNFEVLDTLKKIAKIRREALVKHKAV